MRIDVVNSEGSEWDGFVRENEGWTHFHLFAWKRLIEQVFGHECPYLIARDDAGALAGVLPLVRVKSLLFGHYLVSMPFLNYGGPLGTEEAVAALGAYAADVARSEGVKLLELRSRVPLAIDLPVSHRKVTVLLDLPDDPETLWSGFKAKLRSQIRRPQKEGVVVKFGPDEVEPFYAVFSRHMRDLGTPAQSCTLFDAIATAFPEDAWFGCAYLKGEPIAAGCGFRWGGEFEMTWASALIEYKRVAANMLLYWRFMEHAIGQGVHLFNFGRCTPGGNTHRFKLQWGGREAPLYWYQRGNGKAAATPSPDNGVLSLGPRLWRKLPRRIATSLGPRIVRYIP